MIYIKGIAFENIVCHTSAILSQCHRDCTVYGELTRFNRTEPDFKFGSKKPQCCKHYANMNLVIHVRKNGIWFCYFREIAEICTNVSNVDLSMFTFENFTR